MDDVQLQKHGLAVVAPSKQCIQGQIFNYGHKTKTKKTTSEITPGFWASTFPLLKCDSKSSQINPI